VCRKKSFNKLTIVILITLVSLSMTYGIISNSLRVTKSYDVISVTSLKEKLMNEESFYLYAYFPTCPSCQQFKPVLDKTIELENIEVFAINVKEFADHEDYFISLKIENAPTLIYYNNGLEINRHVGGMSQEKMKTFVIETDKRASNTEE